MSEHPNAHNPMVASPWVPGFPPGFDPGFASGFVPGFAPGFENQRFVREWGLPPDSATPPGALLNHPHCLTPLLTPLVTPG